MLNAQSLYALSINQTLNLILSNPEDTVLVQGEMGSAKSALLGMLGERLPGHKMIYLDCNNMGVEDTFIPNFRMIDEQGVVSMVPNEQLGLHLNRPIILMIDEYGKGNEGLKNMLTRIMNEHEAHGFKLHEGSYVFATTNLGVEGLGDLIKAHQRNRVTVVQMRKATPEEFITYGVNVGLNSAVLGWVREFPNCLASCVNNANPEENEYAYHPRSTRKAFVTQRSLSRAARWVDRADMLDDQTLTAALIGTIGERAALDMAAFIQLAADLPKLVQIKDDPHAAKVPNNSSAVCMVAFRLLGALERDWVDQCIDYVERLPKEAQFLFFNTAREKEYKHRDAILRNAKYGRWALKNNSAFTADKV
jgi:hypothetical protein